MVVLTLDRKLVCLWKILQLFLGQLQKFDFFMILWFHENWFPFMCPEMVSFVLPYLNWWWWHLTKNMTACENFELFHILAFQTLKVYGIMFWAKIVFWPKIVFDQRTVFWPNDHFLTKGTLVWPKPGFLTKHWFLQKSLISYQIALPKDSFFDQSTVFWPKDCFFYQRTIYDQSTIFTKAVFWPKDSLWPKDCVLTKVLFFLYQTTIFD